MGDQFVAEGPKPNKVLAFLPRAKTRDEYGIPQEPVVTIDLRLGKRDAGCFICDRTIPSDSTRVEFRVALRDPIPYGEKGPEGFQRVRTHEKFYAHPGCLTDRVKPEIIRSRMSCYDCGDEPPQMTGHGLIYWSDRCFTVSKFAAAYICKTCTTKPRWKFCDACLVYFPHWMVSETAAAKDVPAAHLAQYMDLAIRENQNVCEYCAKRLGIPTMAESLQAKEDFERLRADIAKHGIFEAGDHD